jgi:hypothetical protein
MKTMNENKIVMCKDKYSEPSDFWVDVIELMDILTKQDYEVLFRYGDCEIYTVEFTYDPSVVPEFEDERFLKVTQDEEDKILYDRDNEREASHDADSEDE